MGSFLPYFTLLHLIPFSSNFNTNSYICEKGLIYCRGNDALPSSNNQLRLVLAGSKSWLRIFFFWTSLSLPPNVLCSPCLSSTRHLASISATYSMLVYLQFVRPLQDPFSSSHKKTKPNVPTTYEITTDSWLPYQCWCILSIPSTSLID